MCPVCMTTIALTAGGATTAGGVMALVLRNPVSRTWRSLARTMTAQARESFRNRNPENRP